MSGFLNNTPVVAMLVPVVEDWAKRWRLSVSRLMIPLSYAAILGGTVTLIGTSTNLIVHGLMLGSTDLPPMGFFEIGAVGLPAALIGVAYVLIAGRWLLPDRRPPLRQPEEAREYAIEMLVERGSPLVGQSIEQAGLRQLPGAFLAEIERAHALLPAVAPHERLYAGDRLLFVGVVESVLDLVRVRGLVPAPDQLFKLDTPRAERSLFEVVVSDSSPVAGKSIRDGGFRSRYEAVVIAVARNGERLRGKVGDIVLRAGDTLLLEARPSFAERQRNSRDFLLIHELAGSSVPRHDRAWVALGILALMVGAAATGLLTMFEAALAAAALTVLTRCAGSASARASIDWSVLAVIGASLGIGRALLDTGAAAAVADWGLALAGNDPWAALLGVYLLTSLFTSLITNNAAAVLIFPIAQSAAESLGVSLMPFVVTIMMAASASFATPISYQTNLMVYGPGGYRFGDYLRIGLPLNVLLGTLVVVLAPLIWPFAADA
jgi:di/tricarboxylate transporter